MPPSSDVVSPLDLALFGGFICHVHGKPIPPPRSRHTTLLLALLALRHDRTMERRVLAEMLWPNRDEESGLAYLRRALLDLRRVLGPESGRILSPTSQSLRLDLSSGAQFDVRDFDRALAAGGDENLDHAIALYRGPLPVDLEEADDLDGFLREERERRAIQFLEALKLRARRRQAAGDLAGAIADLRRLLSGDPYQEAVALQLMRLLIEAKDRAGALAEYHRLRDLLASELGMEPEAEIRAFAERLSQTSQEDASVSTASPPFDRPDPAPATVSGLPVPLTRFFGRKQELQRLRGWILEGPPENRKRLITVSGSPGIGKTRLAIEMARAAAAHPEAIRAVWFVSFAEVREPGAFRSALGRALGLTGKQADDPEQIAARLRGGDEGIGGIAGTAGGAHPRCSLLILDNLEHLLSDPDEPASRDEDEVALLLHDLLTATPSLVCLATSQRPLLLSGEQEMRLETLPFPALGDSPPEVSACDAVALFLDRARLADADFAVDVAGRDRELLASVAALCRTLEGVPLGIELATARLRGGRSATAQILTEISDRQVTLGAVLHDLPPRHRSLQAAIDWSYGLLSEPEKRLLERLSVFVGGCDAAAAQAVCGFAPVEADSVRALIRRLVDHSLLTADNGDEGSSDADQEISPCRYRMLESVRQYAEQKRQESGETAAIRSRHANWYLDFAAANSEQILGGTRQNEWLERFEREQPNFRAAFDELERAEAEREGDTPFYRSKTIRFCYDLYDYWMVRSYFTEAREFCRRALALLNRAVAASGTASPADYFRAFGDREAALSAASALSCLSMSACWLGSMTEARADGERALRLYRDFGKSGQVVSQLCNLGGLVATSDYAAARWYLEEALHLARESGSVRSCAAALTNLGDVAMKQRAYADASAYLEEGLRCFRELGEKHGISMALNNLGEVAVRQDDYVVARRRFQEALTLRRELGDKRGVSFSLRGMADVRLGSDEAREATILWGAADALREEIGSSLATDDAAHLNQKIAQARAMLCAGSPGSSEPGSEPCAVFAAAWDEGRGLNWEQAVRYALRDENEADSHKKG